MITIDRSIDGQQAPVFPMHFQGLLVGKSEGQTQVVLSLRNDVGITPVGLCSVCAQHLLETLTHLKEVSPEYFEAS